MRLSHSKLNVILSCPMSYYLNYKEGISLKVTKSALSVGTAVHWGIEHNTEDLTGYIEEEHSKYDLLQYDYGKEQILAEAMIHGYLLKKEELFNKLLIDNETGEKLDLISEEHELDLVASLKSYKYPVDHEFNGIIDLLLETKKGYIVVDYKTSSSLPDWNKYLDQLYRYIYLLSKTRPDKPVYKIAIINLVKTRIKQKEGIESNEAFLRRLKIEYEEEAYKLINYHEFPESTIDKDLMNDYIDNLSRMADFAQLIDENKVWFINYNNAVGMYGKSDYYDIFYPSKDNEYLYKIRDRIFNEDFEEWSDYRDCLKLDMRCIKEHVLNHYRDFKKELCEMLEVETITKDTLNEINENKKDIADILKTKYVCDETLLRTYFVSLNQEVNELANSGDSNSTLDKKGEQKYGKTL